MKYLGIFAVVFLISTWTHAAPHPDIVPKSLPLPVVHGGPPPLPSPTPPPPSSPVPAAIAAINTTDPVKPAASDAHKIGLSKGCILKKEKCKNKDAKDAKKDAMPMAMSKGMMDKKDDKAGKMMDPKAAAAAEQTITKVSAPLDMMKATADVMQYIKNLTHDLCTAIQKIIGGPLPPPKGEPFEAISFAKQDAGNGTINWFVKVKLTGDGTFWHGKFSSDLHGMSKYIGVQKAKGESDPLVYFD